MVAGVVVAVGSGMGRVGATPSASDLVAGVGWPSGLRMLSVKVNG
jgi:hypothetical protein